MANNKNTTAINSTVLLNKINELADKLKIAGQAKAIGQTEQELIIEANALINSFFNQMSGPIFDPTPILADTKPDLDDYNTNLNNILSDLKVLFLELSNIADLEMSNFNFMVSDSNRLMGRMKSVYSKLGDYILFSEDPNKDSIYFSDSFNNLNRIDSNSKLLINSQVNIDQVQGIATLPIDDAAFTPIQITIAPVINSNSNGAVGNNHEANAQPHNNILDILDNNPDSWFEYEKIIFDNTVGIEPLILDITLNLGESQIVNFIRINPNNFGTQNSIEVETIETSSDGKSFSSIKDDIPLAGFQGDNDTDLFTIAPASSKFAGQALYSFTPRYAKYIHLTLKQTTPYVIKDSNGTLRNRFAIGIRDIEVSAVPYNNVGELISTIYQLDDQAKKVAIVSNQFPQDDFALIAIEHYVSPDDGLTWNRVNPTNVSTTDTSIGDIINYNTLDSNAVTTSSPVNSLRYKAVLKRNDDNFNNPANFKTTHLENGSELIPIPNTTPFDLALTNKPIKSSIKLVDPAFGSRGLDATRYTMGIGNNANQIFILPFRPIKKDKTKVFLSGTYEIQDVDPEQIRVNGELWSRGNLGLCTSTDKIYELDYGTGQVKFGNNINGMAPPSGAIIDLMFLAERLAPTGGTEHIATLDFQTSNDKKTFTITQYGASVNTNELLSKKSYSTTLSNQNLDTNYAPTFSNTTLFATEKAYLDGVAELISVGDYSVDYVNGVVYSKTQTDSATDITINYKFIQTKVLSDLDWDFVKESNYTQIKINDNGFLSLPVSNETLPDGAKYIVLKNLSIVQGSVQFSGGDAAISFFKEVPFVDGQSELITASSTIEAITSLSTGTNSYPLRLPISSAPQLKVTFSNSTVFNTLVAALGDVVADGQYYIDRPGNRIVVYAAGSVDSPGTISYYYNDLMKSNNGLYSINYKTGEIFTSTPIGSGIVISYNYSHYIAQYSIARQVAATDFTYNESNNTITIAEREILNRLNITKKDSTQTNFYQVLYQKVVDNTDLLKALAPYFSPVLRDYALKVITESSLLF